MNIENEDLKQIKKIYGEEMMHLCRSLFSTILEQPGLLYSLLEKNIAPTRNFAFDIKENSLQEAFKNYIYSFINVKQEFVSTTKTPFELLKEKGYTLYECHNESEIQKFGKYYQAGEQLCTFKPYENRNERCHVFFAVKDNVDEIIRKNFLNPSRQDKYGTSVISIQFTRGDVNTLSIKNRYNHKVKNPDATYSNNLENIIPGLTSSFEKYYGFNINQNVNGYSEFFTDDLQYVKANDGKYYRYNEEINGIYYCENNIIIDHGSVIDKYAKEKERYIVIDYFVLDKKDKKIFLYDNRIGDCFIDSIYEIGDIKNITSTKDKTIIIEYSDGKKVHIGLDKFNSIISYKNDYVQNIKERFLVWNRGLMNLEIPNVEVIGNSFLFRNTAMSTVKLEKVRKIGNYFLGFNIIATTVLLPSVEVIGKGFMYHNEFATTLEAPNLQSVGFDFFEDNDRFNIFTPQSNSERKR